MYNNCNIKRNDFRNAIEVLEVEYQNKGFKMSTARLELWHGFFKDFDLTELIFTISAYIERKSEPPQLADLLKAYRTYMIYKRL